MAAISSNDIKNGITLKVEDGLFTVVEFQHVKPGKGGAFVRTKLRNARSGAVIERTYRGDERLEQAIIDKRDMQYLYRDGDDYVFMDQSTYDQVPVSSKSLGDASNFLVETGKAMLVLHDDEIIGIEYEGQVVVGLLVPLHNSDDLLARHGVGQRPRERETIEDGVVDRDRSLVDTPEGVRQSRGEGEADRYGFAVTQFVGVSRQREQFDGVTERVTVVEQGASATLSLIVRHDPGLQLHRHRDEVLPRGSGDRQGVSPFQQPTLCDFAVTAPQFAFGQGP